MVPVFDTVFFFYNFECTACMTHTSILFRGSTWSTLHFRALSATCFILVSCLTYFTTVRWRWHVPLKHHLTFTQPHGFITLKTELFITTGGNLKSCTVFLNGKASLWYDQWFKKLYWFCLLSVSRWFPTWLILRPWR